VKAAPLFLLASLLAVEAAAQARNGSIIGVVSDSVSHQPLRKVEVTLEVKSTAPQPPELRVITDDAGAFAFHDLKPGQYRVVVLRSDYPAWKAITVSPSEDPDPVHIKLVPGAIVSGRILDEDGDSLNGCWVQARPVEHPEQIASSQIFRSDSAPSDYRLFGLRPGKYIMAAQCVVPAFQPRPFSAGPDPPPSLAYPRQFYPAAPDAASAEPLELAAGIDRAGVDFRMQPAHVTQVQAMIAPSSAGWHARDLFGWLIRPGDLSEDEFRRMSPDSPGAFLFPQIFPGSYVLVVTSLGPETRIGGIQRIEVKDQPVNTVIELKRGIDIHGTVELESGSHSAKVQLSQIRMNLVSDYPPFISGDEADVKQDGSFTLNNLLPIPWHIYVYGDSVFIKSVWLGTKEFSGPTLDLSNGLPDTLKIVLSANTATIRGTAQPGATVAYRNLDEKVLSGQSRLVDQSGQFRIEGLAPGRYRVAAGESYEVIPENGGREITVQEGETATVDLPSA
jgi:uncharacterized protein (DUF2141 family)